MKADEVKLVRLQPGRYYAAHDEGIIVSREGENPFWFISYEGTNGDEDDRMIINHRLHEGYDTLKDAKQMVARITHCSICGRFTVLRWSGKCWSCQEKEEEKERAENIRKWQEERKAKLTEIVETVINYTALVRNDESIDNAVKALDELLSYSLRFKREER